MILLEGAFCGASGDSYREWPEHVKFFIFEFSAADRLVFGLEI